MTKSHIRLLLLVMIQAKIKIKNKTLVRGRVEIPTNLHDICAEELAEGHANQRTIWCTEIGHQLLGVQVK